MTYDSWDAEPSLLEFLFWFVVMFSVMIFVASFYGVILGMLSVFPSWGGAFIFWRTKIRK